MILTFWWRRHKQTNKIILEEIGAIETIKQDNGIENDGEGVGSSPGEVFQADT